MRTLRRNQRKLYYATFNEKTPVYYFDKEGNRYETGDSKPTYSAPVEFKGNIAMSGSGYTEAVEFGLDLSDYNATLVVDKDSLPIDETSLIWYENEPKIDDEGFAIRDSADYKVIKVNKSLNVDKYVLKKMVRGNGKDND